MIDLTNIKINKPEELFKGTGNYCLSRTLHKDLFKALYGSGQRPLYLEVVETLPRIHTILFTELGRNYVGDLITKFNKHPFVLSFPYIQYYHFTSRPDTGRKYSDYSDRSECVDYGLVTFSPKSAKDGGPLYQPPLPNFSPFMCITGFGNYIGNHVEHLDVYKFVKLFWNTPFVLDRTTDEGWKYLATLFPNGKNSFEYFKEWEKASKEDPSFVLNNEFWDKKLVYDENIPELTETPISNILKQAIDRGISDAALSRRTKPSSL